MEPLAKMAGLNFGNNNGSGNMNSAGSGYGMNNNNMMNEVGSLDNINDMNMENGAENEEDIEDISVMAVSYTHLIMLMIRICQNT